MNDHDIQGPPVATALPRLLDLAREAIRRRHYSYRTEQAYLHWMKRFILCSGKCRFWPAKTRCTRFRQTQIWRAREHQRPRRGALAAHLLDRRVGHLVTLRVSLREAVYDLAPHATSRTASVD